jgi:hypothetical protein
MHKFYSHSKSTSSSSSSTAEEDRNKVFDMLEREKQHNTTDSWNRLNKTVKLQKLYGFADKYGRNENLSIKEIKQLKNFLNQSLENNKFQKSQCLQYNKDSSEIISIPSLIRNSTMPITGHCFTLKNTDPSRVSTMKSLTPKRSGHKNSTTTTTSIIPSIVIENDTAAAIIMNEDCDNDDDRKDST